MAEINNDQVLGIEEEMRTLVLGSVKKIRDKILLGELEIENDKYEPSNSLKYNNAILAFKIKEFKLNQTLQQKKLVNDRINVINTKINKINYNEFAHSMDKHKQKNNYNLDVHLSPYKKKKIPALKISDDYERKLLDNEAKKFVQKLNKEKKIESSGNNNLILPLISDKYQNKADNYYKNIYNDRSQLKSSPQNESKNENTKFTYLNNNNSIKINNDVNVISPYIPESSQGKKSSKEKQSKIISKIDETIFDNSVSVKSVNKSPYYFNDPKYAKLMEIKKKYNKSINLNTSNNNNNLSNSLGNVVNKKG